MPRLLLPIRSAIPFGVLACALLLTACGPDGSAEDPPLPPADPAPGGAAAPTDSASASAEAGRPGSCDLRPTEPMCYAFTGPGWTADGARTECGGADGSAYRSTSCPADGRVGECVYQPGGDGDRELVYTFYAPMDPLIAEGVCRGTFRAF